MQPKREWHTGFAVFRIMAIRESADGPVATVRVSFDSLEGQEMCVIGQADIRVGGPDGGQVAKCGPVSMELARLVFPSVQDLVEKLFGGRRS